MPKSKENAGDNEATGEKKASVSTKNSKDSTSVSVKKEDSATSSSKKAKKTVEESKKAAKSSSKQASATDKTKKNVAAKRQKKSQDNNSEASSAHAQLLEEAPVSQDNDVVVPNSLEDLRLYSELWSNYFAMKNSQTLGALCKDVMDLHKAEEDHDVSQGLSQDAQAFQKKHKVLYKCLGTDEVHSLILAGYFVADAYELESWAQLELSEVSKERVLELDIDWIKQQYAALEVRPQLDEASTFDKLTLPEGVTLSEQDDEPVFSFSMHWSQEHEGSWSSAAMAKCFNIVTLLVDSGVDGCEVDSQSRDLQRDFWAVATTNEIEVTGFEPTQADKAWFARCEASIMKSYRCAPEKVSGIANAPGASSGGSQSGQDTTVDKDDESVSD